MGHNVDLVWMLGAPEEVKCISCGEIVPTYFEDYDIDLHGPVEPGVWELSVACPECDHDMLCKIECKSTVKLFSGDTI